MSFVEYVKKAFDPVKARYILQLKDDPDEKWCTDIFSVEDVQKAYEAGQRDMRERAAQLMDDRAKLHCSENSWTDNETGALEMDDRVREYVWTLTEQADDVRAIKLEAEL